MVAIIGILAAVAIPAFVRYIRRSKTAEVHESLEKIFKGVRAYSAAEHFDSMGIPVINVPMPQSMTPASHCCGEAGGKCPANPALWNTPGWQALHLGAVVALALTHALTHILARSDRP